MPQASTCTCNHITPILVQRKQAAAMLGISLRGLDYLTTEGRLRTRRIGGRVLISYEEIQKFAKSDRWDPMVPQARKFEAAA